MLRVVARQMATTLDNARLYELEKRRVELEKQDKERTEFINTLIHEIRTPITAMLASSELLREELSGDSTHLSELAENLDIAGHNLNRRVSELTDFVKLRSVEPVLQLRSVNIEEILRLARATLEDSLGVEVKKLGAEVRLQQAAPARTPTPS